jgi:hypothetical protein
MLLAALYLLLCVPAVNAQTVSAPGARSPVKKPEAMRQELSVQERAARGEIPFSRVYDFIKVEAQAIHRLPPLDESEKQQEAGPEMKLKVGAARPFQTPLEILSGGTPYSIAEGEVRVIGVVSEGALFTRVHFDKTAMPRGARLFVSSMNNPDEVYGPYDGHGPSEDGSFWSPPVKGEGVVIEYFSPAGAAESAGEPFQVVGVSHGFLDPLADGNPSFAAGACNLEVPPAYANTATGVGLLVYTLPDGDHSCTGTLLNTQSSSFIPYLITANHCFSTQSAAQTLRVYWNYNTGDSPPVGTTFTDGANLLATGPSSDFTFVRLTGSVPGGLLYNGWTTAMPAPGDSVTGIHHPEASHKRFSYGFVTDPYCPSNFLPGPCQNFLTMVWSGGTVEHGSSGSELIVGSPPNTTYVGNLLGGNASCDNPSGYSFYGRFDVTYPNISVYLANASSCTPPATAISIGNTVGGSLATSDCRSPLRGNNFYADRYAFFGSAGQTVTLALSSSSFDTYLYLVDPFGQVVAQDDDGGGGTNSRIQITLPTSGTYTAEVTSFLTNITGGYTLSLSPVAGNGKSVSAGLYNPATSTFFLRNSNSAGAANLTFPFGPANSGWLPLVGDWNADGVQTVGLYNKTTSTFFLKNTNSGGAADLVFSYGPAGSGWVPLVGDWDGDGVQTVGLYNPATSTFFLKNSNTAGAANQVFGYGPSGAGWLPLVGDWNGDGIDTVGLYNPFTSTFFLRNTNSSGSANIVVSYGPAAGWKPIAGDWNGDGIDTVGLYNPFTSTFFLRNANAEGPADLTFSYGPAGAGWTPLGGNWDGL